MKNTQHDRVRIGLFEVNLRVGELRQASGSVFLLPDQPLQILRMLVEAEGDIVTRDEIQHRLWPEDTVVEFDHSINAAVKKLRHALGDSADDPCYIETIAKRGYRLRVPLEPASLVASSNGNGHQIPAEAPTEAAPSSKRAWVIAGVLAIVAVAGLFGYHRLNSQPKLRNKDTVVLAEFANSTGDKVFDGTLKQALSLQLEQSPFLNVLSEDRISETLKLMNRPSNERLTREIAKEVCLRSNSKALLVGTIALVGDRYMLGLKAEDCQTGDTLASVEEEAEGRNHVLEALDRVANQIRGKLGESLVRKFNQPLDQVTTASLEALQAYTEGQKLEEEQGLDAGVPYLKRAIELDPSFAIAYAALGEAYKQNYDEALKVPYLTRAYELRDHASQRERFDIESKYYLEITGEQEKAIKTFTEWTEAYPNDDGPYIQLANTYHTIGMPEKAATAAQQAIRLKPDQIAYMELSDAYAAMNRLQDAKSVLQEAQAKGIDGPIFRQRLFVLAFLEKDAAEMKLQDNWAMGKPGIEALQLMMDSSAAVYHGRLAEARELQRRAEESGMRAGAKEMAAYMTVVHGPIEAEIGDAAAARAAVKQALTLLQSDNEEVEGSAALTFAVLGDTGQARRLADKINGTNPLDTMTQVYTLPTIKAVMELKQNNPGGAVDMLRAVAPHDSANLNMPPNAMYSAYVRGLAYLELRQGKEAAAEFQKVIDSPGIVKLHAQGALAHLQLARAQVLRGHKALARKSYQDFLALWKDADSNIPTYRQAKAEYAKLQ